MTKVQEQCIAMVMSAAFWAAVREYALSLALGEIRQVIRGQEQ
jgi:hypothetical protein